MKFFLSIALSIFILSGCRPVTLATRRLPAVTEAPVIVNSPLVNTPGVKVVELATLTPVRPVSTPTSDTTPLDPNQPTPASAPAGLPKTLAELGVPAITYQDDFAGLAFEYPAGWILTAPAAEDKSNAAIYSVTLRSGDISRGPKQQEGIPAGMAAIDVTIFVQGPKTLEQAINERRAQATQSESGQPVQIVLEEEWTLREGLKAHRFLYNLGKEGPGDSGPDRMSSELVTMIHDKMVLVTGLGDQSMFNIVAGSLRELK